MLREHFRVPGMGDTTARYFRDKLAMRVRAREAGLLVPDFVHALNHDDLRAFMANVPSPWVLKPRSEGSAAGIKKVTEPDALWRHLDEFGDCQSFYLLERYVPGDVYHVDSIVSEREVVFTEVSRYGKPPFDVMHSGGLFTTRTLPPESPEVQALIGHNREVLDALGFVRGVTHTEFIKGRDDGRFYFLETAARVGGAHIVEVIEAATGINLWAEWAKIEIAGGHQPYQLPPTRSDHAGIIVSLAKQEWPDTSAYDDSEVVWRLKKRHHVGLIVASPTASRVEQLMERYSARVSRRVLCLAAWPRAAVPVASLLMRSDSWPFVVFVAPYFTETAKRFIAAMLRVPEIRVGIVSQEPLEQLPHALGQELSAHWRIDDALSAGQLAAAVVALRDRHGPIHRLLGIVEQIQVPLAEVREQLGIPGMRVEQAQNFRDKARMKERLRAAGLPCAQHRLVDERTRRLGLRRRGGVPAGRQAPGGCGGAVDEASQ